MVKVQFQKSQQNFLRLLPHQATISEDVFISGSPTTNSLQLWRLLAQVLHLNLSSKILYSNNLINPVSPFNTCNDLILELSYTRINTVSKKYYTHLDIIWSFNIYFDWSHNQKFLDPNDYLCMNSSTANSRMVSKNLFPNQVL